MIMGKDLVKGVGSIGQDNLIAKLTPAAETFGIVLARLAEAATIRRGTLLAKDASGKYVIYGGAGNAKTKEFNGDGSEKTFTLTDKPNDIIEVKVGGTAVAVDTYNRFSGVVTLVSAPAAGTKNVVVSYVLGDAAVPSAILAEDVEVGTSADETAVAYRCGNFNPEALIVQEGYTLSEDDLDTLRKYDIIFTQMI